MPEKPLRFTQTWRSVRLRVSQIANLIILYIFFSHSHLFQMIPKRIFFSCDAPKFSQTFLQKHRLVPPIRTHYDSVHAKTRHISCWFQREIDCSWAVVDTIDLNRGIVSEKRLQTCRRTGKLHLYIVYVYEELWKNNINSLLAVFSH